MKYFNFRWKKSILLPLGLALLLGCAEEKQNWVLQLSPEWEKTPLELEKDYTWEGKSLRFTTFQMYVSGLSALDSDGLMHLFPQSEYLFNHQGADLSFSLPDGVTVSELYGHVGVDPLRNDSTGNQAIAAWEYPDEHPLSAAQGMYWSWKPGYIFIKMEGRIDLDGDGQYLSAGETFSLHPGLSSLYTGFNLSGPENQTENKIKLSMDLSAFFVGYPLADAGKNVHAMHANDAAYPYAEMLMARIPHVFYALEN